MVTRLILAGGRGDRSLGPRSADVLPGWCDGRLHVRLNGDRGRRLVIGRRAQRHLLRTPSVGDFGGTYAVAAPAPVFSGTTATITYTTAVTEYFKVEALVGTAWVSAPSSIATNGGIAGLRHHRDHITEMHQQLMRRMRMG